MTLRLIDEIYLYISVEPEHSIVNNEIIAWLDHTDISYTILNYGPDSHQGVFDALNTWWQLDENGQKQGPISSFPFVVYTEAHSDKPISYLPKKYLLGKDEILSKLSNLYTLGR
jgi:hypothetical protein